MASTINGTSTGNGGLISTGDDSGILNIQTNETTAIAIDASQCAAFVAGTAAAPSITTTGDTNTGIFFPAADTIAFSEGGAESMRIDSSGNAGIGTSSPSAKLTVVSTYVSDTTVQTRFSDNTGGRLEFGGNASGGKWINANDLGTSTALPLIFQNGSNVERMRIDTSGNLLVGTTSANAVGTTIAAPDSGGIYLNTSTTGARNQIRFVNPNGTVGSIQTSGSATAYNTSSDYRLKENITPMTDALEKVAQLKPVTYKWKVDGSDGEGFIAHELAEVKPDCVSGEKDAVDADGNPKYQGIDTSFLVATLTAALQELKALNDTQAETINALTARVVNLEGA